MSAGAPHRFYLRTLEAVPAAPALPPGVRVAFWRPRDAFTPPAAIRSKVNRVWALFDRAGVFANGDFAVIQLYEGDRLLHRAGIFPGFFRFPFMALDDLQVGDTWTDPAARGRGLATLAIGLVLAQCGRPGRRFWYLVEEANAPSIRVIEKAGFTLAGTGARLPRAGVSALGYYAITRAAAAAPSPLTPSLP